MSEAPKRGTPEYTWWSAGAHAEVDARRDGRSKAGLQVRSLVDAIAEHRHEMDEAQIATDVFSIYTLAGQPFRTRLRLALWVLRNGEKRAQHKPQVRRPEGDM